MRARRMNRHLISQLLSLERKKAASAEETLYVNKHY